MTARLREFVTLTFNESSPLNQAYLMERRAEDSANVANYSDSTKYYNLAIEHLKEAQSKALHPKSQELIAAQINRNLCAIDANGKLQKLRLKEKELEERKKMNLNNNSDIVSNFYDSKKTKGDTVKYEIYRAMEQQGSLLEILVANNSSHSAQSAPVSPKTANQLQKSANKVPVCDKTTIEELKLTNQQLKLLVRQLLVQLDEESAKTHSLQVEIQALRQELNHDHDTKSLPAYLDDSLDTPKLLY